MNLLNPWMLGFLAIIPPLILLYFLKLKRPQVVVPSTLLWRKVVEDLRVNSPFQRLRRSLLLLLQLLILLLFILALARPFIKTDAILKKSMIVLIDTSASMGALEPSGKSRLHLAKEELRSLIDNVTSEDQLMLIGFSDNATILQSFTSNKRQLHDAVDAIDQTQRPTSIRGAFMLAKSLQRSAPNARLAVLSDGAFPDPGLLELPMQIEYQMIGNDLPNLAITSLDIRRSLRDRLLVEMFVSLQNFGTESMAGNMQVFLDDVLLDSKFVSLEAGKTLSQIFEARLAESGEVRVHLDVEDALAADNDAWQIVLPPQERSVMIVGKRNYFLERVFEAAGNVVVDSRPREDFVAEDAAEYTAVIWNRVADPEIAKTNNIYLGCFPELDGLQTGELVQSPSIMDWDNSHPVNRFIDFSNLLIQESPLMMLPKGGQALLSSPTSALIGLTSVDMHSLCIVAFNPFASNWPLLVSFPIFLHNCLNYFDEQYAQAENANLLVGRTITSPAEFGAATIRLPNGATVPMQQTGEGGYVFAGVNQLGIYGVETGSGLSRKVAANLFDTQESRLGVQPDPQVSGEQLKAVQLSRQVNTELSTVLLAVALGLLLLEWVVFHRRLFV